MKRHIIIFFIIISLALIPACSKKGGNNAKAGVGKILEEEKILDNFVSEVDFEHWGHLKLVPAVSNTKGVESLKLYLTEEDGDVIYTFQDFPGNDMYSFFEMRVVDFSDIDADNDRDITVIADYITGIGSMGAVPFHMVCIYFQTNSSFTVRPEINDEINTMMGNESVEKILEYVKKD